MNIICVGCFVSIVHGLVTVTIIILFDGKLQTYNIILQYYQFIIQRKNQINVELFANYKYLYKLPIYIYYKLLIINSSIIIYKPR